MLKNQMVAILGLTLVAACAPSAASLSTAIAQTQAAAASATPVPTLTILPSETPLPAPTATPRPFSAREVVIDPNIVDAAPLGLTAGVSIVQHPTLWPLDSVPGTEFQMSRQLLS